jgi:hypothetical protein
MPCPLGHSDEGVVLIGDAVEMGSSMMMMMVAVSLAQACNQSRRSISAAAIFFLDPGIMYVGNVKKNV